MDGYIRIKTKIDNSEIDKQIKTLEAKIKKLQEDNTRKSQEQDVLQSEINKYEELTQNAEEYRQTIKKLEQDKANMVKTDPNLVVSTTPEYNNISTQLDAIKQKYMKATAEIDKQAPKIKKVYTKLSQIKDKQEENNLKMIQYRQEIEKVNMNNIQKGVNNVGKGISNQIKKIGKLAFAVVGIRSAWFAVRGAMNLVTRYDNQSAIDFEYIGFAISQILVPAVQQLAKLLYTVLSYVNAIMSAWFGINLFSNASAKAFQRMKNNASGTAKSVKEIQKSLQGFDEMNVISDSSKSNGTTAGGVAPSMDLSGMQGEIPAWLKWIIDNKDLITSVLGGIAAGILAIKFGLNGIKSLGISMMVTGIIKLVQDLQEYLKDPSWENFGKIITDIGLIVLGLGIIIGGVPAIIGGAIAIIVGLVVSNWQKIKELLQKAIEWIEEKINAFPGIANIVGNSILAIFKGVIEMVLNLFDGLFTGVKQILDGIIMIFKGDFKGGITSVAKGIGNILIGVVNGVTSGINAILYPIRTLIVEAGKIAGKNWTLNKISIPKIPLLAKGTVVSRPTPAIIGEAGAEAVVPLENNLEWLDKMADMISSKIGGSGNVNVYLDGRLIQRQMAKRGQQLAFSTNS